MRGRKARTTETALETFMVKGMFMQRKAASMLVRARVSGMSPVSPLK